MGYKLKTGLFGFNKKATMNYIEGYQTECCEKLKVLKDELDSLHEQNARFADENNRLKAELDDTLAILEAEKKNCESLTSQLEVAKTEIAELSAVKSEDNLKNYTERLSSRVKSSPIHSILNILRG